VKSFLLHRHCLNLVFKLLNDSTVNLLLFFKALSVLLLALARIKARYLKLVIADKMTKCNM